MFLLHLLTDPVSPRLYLGRTLYLFSHSVELLLRDELVISFLLSPCHHLRFYSRVYFNLRTSNLLGLSKLTFYAAFIVTELFFDLFSHFLNEFDTVLIPLKEFRVVVRWVQV